MVKLLHFVFVLYKSRLLFDTSEKFGFVCDFGDRLGDEKNVAWIFV